MVIRVGEMPGALGGTRTHGLILRRDALYPSELQARVTETDNFEELGRFRTPYCVIGWCRRRDSNPHALFGHYILNVARLPIPPLRHVLGVYPTPPTLAHLSGGRSRGRTSDLLRVKQAL